MIQIVLEYDVNDESIEIARTIHDAVIKTLSENDAPAVVNSFLLIESEGDTLATTE